MPRGETPATKNEMPLSPLLPFFDLRVGSVARCSSGRERGGESAWHTTRLVEEGGFFFQLLHARFVAFLGGKGGWRPLFPSFFYDNNNFQQQFSLLLSCFPFLFQLFSLSLVIHRLPHSWLIMKNLLFSVWLCFSDKRT